MRKSTAIILSAALSRVEQSLTSKQSEPSARVEIVWVLPKPANGIVACCFFHSYPEAFIEQVMRRRGTNLSCICKGICKSIWEAVFAWEAALVIQLYIAVYSHRQSSLVS